MSAATSGGQPRGMNMTALTYYQAEIDYRREQMRRDREPLRLWRRSRAKAPTTTAPKNRAALSERSVRPTRHHGGRAPA